MVQLIRWKWYCNVYIKCKFDGADLDEAQQSGAGHFYDIFFEGCLTNFEIGEGAEEASKLFPEVNYTTMDDYLKIFL